MEDKCTFNQNGGCLFYDTIQGDIDKCIDLLNDTIGHKNLYSGITLEVIKILEEMKEKA